jgi:hypothetical protein
MIQTTYLSISAPEILTHWNNYLIESMALQVTKYFLLKAEDKDVIKLLQFALQVAERGTEGSKKFLENANHPIPEGFREEDVNMHAPRVYSDNLVVLIKNRLAQDANVVLSMSLGASSRSDIWNFFEKQLTDTSRITSMCLELIQKKGLYHPVHIRMPENNEKVKSQSYLGGLFFKHRSLNTAEIYQLVTNFELTEVLSIFFKSFTQFNVIKDGGLRQHFQRGAEMTDKQLQIFQSLSSENGLPKLPTWESELTENTISPFSERMILFKTAILLSATASRYGVAQSTVMRKDIGVDFMRLMTETLLYAEDSMNLMINKGYFNQHPLAKKEEL